MITRRNRWLLGGLVVVVMFVGWRMLHRHPAPSYRSIQVARGDLQMTVLATGTVEPQNRLEIKPPIPGRTEEILVEEGQAVTQGQLLIWMSSTERAALLDAARARGPQELAHWQELYTPTPIIAPINGTVIVRNVEPGQTVTASDAILVLSDRLIVKAQVDETDIGQIRLDQYARITLDAYPDQSINSRVNHIKYEATTVNNVTVYEVDVLPAQVPEFMRSGMTANVTFRISEKHHALILPAETVHQEHGATTVLVPGRTRAHPVSQEITIGLSDGKHVEVVSGLKEGDPVLTTVVSIPHSSGSAQGSPFTPFGGRTQRSGGRSN